MKSENEYVDGDYRIHRSIVDHSIIRVFKWFDGFWYYQGTVDNKDLIEKGYDINSDELITVYWTLYKH